MSVTSEATSVWKGELSSGSGTISLDSSKAAEFSVNWKARSEGESGTTTPEELLGAAHASCFSMAFSNILTTAGFPPERIQTTAAVTFSAADVAITGSHLLVRASVPGISEEDFNKYADDAKQNCPVSRALAGIDITLEASLV